MDDLAGAGIIGRVGVTQLAIDVEHSLFLRVTGVFGQRVEDDAVVLSSLLVLVYQDRLGTTLQNFEQVVFRNLRTAIHDNLVTLDGNHLTRILIYEVLVPALQQTGCELRTDDGLQRFLVDLHLLGKVENLQNILVGFKTDSTK